MTICIRACPRGGEIVAEHCVDDRVIRAYRRDELPGVAAGMLVSYAVYPERGYLPVVALQALTVWAETAPVPRD